jgi:flagellin
MGSLSINASPSVAIRSLYDSSLRASTAMERLSSGLRINSADDDAAGLTVASRLTANLVGIQQGIRNLSDGYSLISTADGAMEEIANILNRLRVLATQSSSGTYQDTDRASSNSEYQQLISEINRISESTTFNEMNLLATRFTFDYPPEYALGQFSIAAGDSSNASIPVAIDSTAAYDVKTFDAAFSAGSTMTLTVKSTQTGQTYSLTAAGVTSVADAVSKFAADANYDPSVFTVEVNEGADNQSADGVLAVKWVGSQNLTPFVDVDAHATLNDGSATLTGSYYAGALSSISGSSIATSSAAQGSLAKIDTAIDALSANRAALGAIQNRIQFAIGSQLILSQSLQEARSRILDADYAAESATLAKYNILQQSSSAMLAQSNQLSSLILGLLR